MRYTKLYQWKDINPCVPNELFFLSFLLNLKTRETFNLVFAKDEREKRGKSVSIISMKMKEKVFGRKWDFHSPPHEEKRLCMKFGFFSS